MNRFLDLLALLVVGAMSLMAFGGGLQQTTPSLDTVVGVQVTVLQEKEYQDGEPVESTLDCFAQHRNGDSPEPLHSGLSCWLAPRPGADCNISVALSKRLPCDAAFIL